MAKRKGSTNKTKDKTSKIQVTMTEKNETSIETLPTNTENIETNDEKLDNFKRKFGMLKSVTNEKLWIKGNGYLVYNPSEIKPSNKISSFDLDDTLIVSKSGTRFAGTWSDWKFMLDDIPKKLKELHKDGYKLVIFTNQGGVEKKKITENDIKRKIESIVEKLALEIQVFVSISYANTCRKPNCGMFDLLVEKYNSGIKISLEDSFFVGDAAGRPNEWAPNKKKDFSCSDRLFALNSQIKFYTPEEYFLGAKEAVYNLPTFNPKEYVKNSSEMVIKYDDKMTNNFKDLLPKDDTELVMIIMVGSAASGKSTFCQNYLLPLGFDIVNRDKLNTWQKCVAEAKRLLSEKKSVVIDNTNPDIVSRDRYISVGLEMGVKHIICSIMDVSEEHCRHNEIFRELTNTEHSKISELVFRKYKSSYQEPTTAEKFSLICKIVPGLIFESEDYKNLYSRYL